MKYLIFFLFLFSCLVTYAQGPVVAGTVQTVAAMKSYFGPVNKMYVVATNSEYVLCTTSCTADEVTVFAGTSGKKWKRVIQSNIPRDSIVGLNTLLASKIGASDTSTFRGTDRNYALTLANARVRYTDTAAYRAVDRAYAAGLVTAKLNISDTAAARAADRAYANSRAIFHVQNYNDTATASYPIAVTAILGDTIPVQGGHIRQKFDSVAIAFTGKMDNNQNILGSATKAATPWSTGTVTVNSNTQRHDVTITAAGARTLVVSNINTQRSVVMWIDNTSGSTVTLTLPANSFLQNPTTGIYASAASVIIAQGKTVLVLSNYDGVNYWFNY